MFNGNHATGVEVNKDGQDHMVRANKDIILSAGAIETPKLLMLSGIGPREQLEKYKVRR